MSRMQSAIFTGIIILALSGGAPADAQQLSDAEIDAMIEKQRRQIAVDAEGCRKYPREGEEDVIVVCGGDPVAGAQRIFPHNDDPDKIRRGEAVSTERAAQCIGGFIRCGHQLKPFTTVGFGYVKPMAVDWNETMKGLPEPDMIVAEGTQAAELAAAEQQVKEVADTEPEPVGAPEQ